MPQVEWVQQVRGQVWWVPQVWRVQRVLRRACRCFPVSGGGGEADVVSSRVDPVSFAGTL